MLGLTPQQCVVRGLMPQVDEVDIPDLVAFLRGRGVGVSTGLVDPRKVRGRQTVDRAKVRAMPLAVLDKPCLLSTEPLVVDGNHRWMGHIWHRSPRMLAHTIALPFDQSLRAVFEFPRTYYYSDGKHHPIRN